MLLARHLLLYPAPHMTTPDFPSPPPLNVLSVNARRREILKPVYHPRIRNDALDTLAKIRRRKGSKLQAQRQAGEPCLRAVLAERGDIYAARVVAHSINWCKFRCTIISCTLFIVLSSRFVSVALV